MAKDKIKIAATSALRWKMSDRIEVRRSHLFLLIAILAFSNLSRYNKFQALEAAKGSPVSSQGCSHPCKTEKLTKDLDINATERPDQAANCTSPYGKLETYIENLRILREHWRKVARLTYEDKIKEAREVLQDDLPVSVDSKWHSLSERLDKRLDPRRRAQIMDFQLEFPKVFLIMESPELGADYLEAAQEKSELDFKWTIYLSQCLIETRRYSHAKEILRALLQKKGASGWKDTINSRLKAFQDLEDGEAPPAEFYRRWYTSKLGPILSIWEKGRDTQNLQVLAALFSKAADEYGEKLALELIVEQASKTGNREDAASALLQLANKAYKHKEYDEALRLWRQIENDCKDTRSWGKAVFNIGIALKEQNRFDEAIKIFKKLLASDVNDRDRGGHIMEAYRNYRPKAQWEIGHCLFAKGDYAGALQAYRATEQEHPFESWCGTCQWGYEYRYALYQGLCLEYLGRHYQAVQSYFRPAEDGFLSDATIPIRLVDIYQTAGRTATLKRILAQIEKRFKKKRLRELGKKARKKVDLQEHLPTRMIRRVLEIRKTGKKADLQGLVDILKAEPGGSGPEEYDGRKQHWRAIEAAKALAEHPKQAVPLLNTAMSECNENRLIYYALGLCGTPEAIKTLKSEAEKLTNIWPALSVVYALSLAGDVGKATLSQLAEFAKQNPDTAFNLKIAIQHYEQGKLGDAQKEIKFPTLPKKTKLPVRLAQVEGRIDIYVLMPAVVCLFGLLVLIRVLYRVNSNLTKSF